jgi:hypothetical protein
VLSLFVVLVVIGYLVALLNMYLTYSPVDGKPGLSTDDLKRALYGNRTNTILGTVISGGSMEQYLQNPDDKGRILSWIQDGARESEFAKVQPVFTQSCTRCHSATGSASFRPLSNFKEVVAVTQVDRGETLPTWARVAHTHLQALALIYLVLGILFVLCNLPSAVRIAGAVTPFIALLADFGTRALVPIWPSMISGMMLAGSLMGLATATMSLGILWELWRKPGSPPAPDEH